MPQSLVSLNCHIVFSTKHREPLITDAVQARLYAYIGGVARQSGSTLLGIGGTFDHVHLLLSLGKQTCVSDCVRDIKANSSRWIHETFENLHGFAWQTGYGAFSVSCSNLDGVKRYIAEQQEHHQVQTFKEEFISLLRRHHIEYDERYIWD